MAKCPLHCANNPNSWLHDLQTSKLSNRSRGKLVTFWNLEFPPERQEHLIYDHMTIFFKCSHGHSQIEVSVRLALRVENGESCANTVRTPPRSYARSCPLGSSPHSCRSIPLQQHRPHSSAQLRSLISTEPFSPPISLHSLAPNTVRTPPRSYARSCPLVFSPHSFPFSLLPPISIIPFLLRQLEPYAVSGLNKNPSIEDAFRNKPYSR